MSGSGFRVYREAIRLDPVDQKILVLVQDGIPLSPHPFSETARITGLSEEQVVERVRNLIGSGDIRRFGARINQRNLGQVYNAMVAWYVPDEKVSETGIAMAGYPDVTHCYERECPAGRWHYNIYTVLHGYSTEEIEGHVRNISSMTGITDYDILYSTRVLKRTSPGRVVMTGEPK
jgi:siroheme decarboxylase